MPLFDVEIQLKEKDIWIRVNDIEATNEEEAEKLAENKIVKELGVDVRPMGRWVEFPNTL